MFADAQRDDHGVLSDYNVPKPQLSVEDAQQLLAQHVPTFNHEQLQVFNRAKTLIDQRKECITNHKKVEGYILAILAPGGTGKSYVLKSIRWYAHSQFAESPDDFVCAVAAPTGAAAVVCDGATMHQLFSLPVQQRSQLHGLKLTSRKLNQMRSLLGKVQLMILDEIR